MVVNTRSKTAVNNAAGAQQSNEHEPLRESLLSFRMDTVGSGLGTRQVYDEIMGDYGPAEPMFYVRTGDKYVDFPKNSEFLTAFGKYLIQVGEAIEGVVFKTSVEHTPADVQRAKETLDKFRKR